MTAITSTNTDLDLASLQLASSAANYITGQSITIDGGMSVAL